MHKRWLAGLLIVAVLIMGGVAVAPVAGAKAKAHATTTTKLEHKQKKKHKKKHRSPTTTTTRPISPTSSVALEIPSSGPGGFNYTQGSYLEGFEFTAKSPASITALGAYDSNLSSLPNGAETFAAVPVAVWDLTTNTEVASASVNPADPSTGIYRYAKLKSPVALKTSSTYAVVWVSLTNHYVASPVLDESDIDPAINYLGYASYGTGGLQQTEAMEEPNWFYTVAEFGTAAIGYDLGPNFMLRSTSTSKSTPTSTSLPTAGVTVALGKNNPAQGDCTTNTSEAAASVGSVVLTVTSSSFQADIQLEEGVPNTTYGVFLQQVPGSCPQSTANGGTLVTDSSGRGNAVATVPRVSGATTLFVQLVPLGSTAPSYTSDRISGVS